MVLYYITETLFEQWQDIFERAGIGIFQSRPEEGMIVLELKDEAEREKIRELIFGNTVEGSGTDQKSSS